jgi:hypothetical protein
MTPSSIVTCHVAQQFPENYARRLGIIKRLKIIHGPWVLMPNCRSPGLYEASLDVIETKRLSSTRGAEEK